MFTGSGAMLANDMHLPWRVPTVWYRARLQVGDADTSWRYLKDGLSLFAEHRDISAGVMFIALAAALNKDGGDNDLEINTGAGDDSVVLKSVWVQDDLRVLGSERAAVVGGEPHGRLLVAEQPHRVGDPHRRPTAFSYRPVSRPWGS